MTNRNIKRTYRDRGKAKLEITFPLVEVGNVIEYSFTVTTRNLLEVTPWYFQSDLPVLVSELHTYLPQAIRYVPFFQGATAGLEHAWEPFSRPGGGIPIHHSPSEWAATPHHGIENHYTLQRGEHHLYRMVDLPALTQEAMAPDARSYAASLRLRLAEQDLRLSVSNPLYETWQKLDRDLHKRYRMRRRDKRSVTEWLGQRLLRSEPPQQLLTSIYERVRTRFRWDSTYTLQPGRWEQALKRAGGQATGAEINLLLAHCLQVAGFEAYPLLISTRDHGQIQTRYPLLTQFNHLVVVVHENGDELLLDAADPEASFGLLAPNDLNYAGYLINGEGGRWVMVDQLNQRERTIISRFDVIPSGLLVGNISVTHRASTAMVERQRLSRYDQAGQKNYFAEHVLDGMQAEIYEPTIDNMDNPLEPLVFSCDIKTGEFVKVAGEYLIIEPMMIQALLENPLPQTQRKAPVDLSYPIREALMIGLRIPDNYEVAQLPAPQRVLLPDGAGSFTYNVVTMDDVLYFSSVLLLKQTFYSPQDYHAIRSFFDYIVRKHDEDIVLKKKSQVEE